jgi:hypothetical protein
MSKLHVNRDRQSLGQFTPEDVADGLASGRFLPSDLAWREGMETWKPLGEWTDLPAVQSSPTVAPGEQVLAPAIPTVLTPAWEQDGPLSTRVVETIKSVLLTPTAAFSNIGEQDNYLKPLTFLILVGWPANVIAIIYQAIIETVNSRATPEMTTGMILTIYAVFAVSIPVLLTVGAFLLAGIYHLILKLLGGATRPFATTFRVVCYSGGAASALVVIPFCGGFAQPFWNLFCVIVGLREAHRTTTLIAVAAGLIPVVLCCGGALGAVALIYSALPAGAMR